MPGDGVGGERAEAFGGGHVGREGERLLRLPRWGPDEAGARRRNAGRRGPGARWWVAVKVVGETARLEGVAGMPSGGETEVIGRKTGARPGCGGASRGLA